jgi:hydroxymethylpyrimidine/phosphomethylpyrimidine kinase
LYVIRFFIAEGLPFFCVCHYPINSEKKSMTEGEFRKQMRNYTRVLTIAGSDSGGGAGIGADLKTIAACGCYGMSVITAVTVQNTKGVSDIHPVPAAVIGAQIRAVLDDIGADGIKIGMLYSKEAMEAVAEILGGYPGIPVVLDPVMVATSGDALTREEVGQTMKARLFPLLSLLTPNVPEAQSLLGRTIGDDSADAARRMGKEFSCSVLLKGGHRGGEMLVDVLYDHDSEVVTTFENKRIDTCNTHGTGCTLSSAVTSFLAKGVPLADAVGRAEEYLHAAIVAGAGYRLGSGQGPVHHFHSYWQ